MVFSEMSDVIDSRSIDGRADVRVTSVNSIAVSLSRFLPADQC